ncbi:tricarballylate utilization 4Fe-4S protein TcuB [uncultured Thiohalocapsa sp.]|uniref:tricarballylate utilization 4Fe-4S protein TcuB n=1 Tax=uncultured Thiohalocapsa sp. TaxID=768990 RepID=UPI0025D2CFC5|nr:tricarballylate utilization 4Fe-4S protein TcuB [uncultured Thiohalocapsa sp.]
MQTRTLPTVDADAAAEARRQLAICNICGYCNGLCAVFSAAERRPRLADGDLDQLANLCHHCRSCLYDCQYAPPHAFAINLPRALARQRRQSYARYTWPRPLAALFTGGGLRAGLPAAGVVLAFTLAVVLAVPVEVLFGVHSGPGAFYQVIPFGVMTAGAALSLGFALLAVGMGLRRFRQATAATQPAGSPGSAAGRATLAVLTLDNQAGGGPGCADLDHHPSRLRRRFHHALFYGFLLCLASTLVAAARHHLLGEAAPYPLLSAPVLLGTAGGLGMLVGGLGMHWLRRREDPTPTDPDSRGADTALTWLLLAVAATGLALLALRGTAAMGLLLAVHLGTVLALFVLLPYSKMVHAVYRGAALWQDARERDGT